ncbi:hypothetical protein EVAR_79200_1 [Eumeta japonica]|uniref:Uncharacterized protein n=1 Tax=Eumeta variegata TaxID=151549 RepID=A0A4C1UT60_EUMVA|nr:hypothetical protein EVAR_79200_1 [Eumeta japonica]
MKVKKMPDARPLREPRTRFNCVVVAGRLTGGVSCIARAHTCGAVSTGQIPHSHRISSTTTTAAAVAFHPVRVPVAHSHLHQIFPPSFKYPILTQEASNALAKSELWYPGLSIPRRNSLQHDFRSWTLDVKDSTVLRQSKSVQANAVWTRRDDVALKRSSVHGGASVIVRQLRYDSD